MKTEVLRTFNPEERLAFIEANPQLAHLVSRFDDESGQLRVVSGIEKIIESMIVDPGKKTSDTTE